LSISPNSTRRDLFKTGVDMPVGAREPSEMKTAEIPRRRATSKIADAYSRVNPCIHTKKSLRFLFFTSAGSKVSAAESLADSDPKTMHAKYSLYLHGIISPCTACCSYRSEQVPQKTHNACAPVMKFLTLQRGYVQRTEGFGNKCVVVTVFC
jgi:hypothetical protein